jgi:hypothetical protein
MGVCAISLQAHLLPRGGCKLLYGRRLRDRLGIGDFSGESSG